MEEEAPPKRSVAELAGKFRNTAPTPCPTGNEGGKPVRRRPPRTLQLPNRTQGEEEQKPGATSPLPAKAKRNSALIEKLQANLTLSPSAFLPSPKSPGLRVLPPSFTPPSPCGPAVAVTTVTPIPTATPTSPVSTIPPQSEEEAPTSFETPAAATEGSILPSINKGRARLSIRRRPPSRRHRMSSSGEEIVGATGEEDPPLSFPSSPKAKTAEEEVGRVERDEEVFHKETKEEGTEADSCVGPKVETETKTETETTSTASPGQTASSPGKMEPEGKPLSKNRLVPQEEERKGERKKEEGAQPVKEGSKDGVKGEENGSVGEKEGERSSSGSNKQSDKPMGERGEGEEVSCKKREGKKDEDVTEGSKNKQTRYQSSDG